MDGRNQSTQQGPDILGQVKLTVSRAECYGGRRIHLRLEGLPGWLLDLLFNAGPFVVEASSSRSDRSDQSGPNSLLLGSTKVLEMVAPTSPTTAEPVPE